MFAIHGAYYDNNFGDLLLMRIFENWIRSTCSSPIVYPLVPKSEYVRFGCSFPDVHVGIRSHAQWQGVLYAGGGHFGEPQRQAQKGYRGHRNWNLRFILRHVLPAELCIRNQVPYIIAGVEVGPVSNPLIRQEIRRIFRHAAVISVRNEESQRYVQETLGIDAVHCIPDVALTLTHEHIPSHVTESVKQMLTPYGDRPLLGIHHARYILADTPQAETLRTQLIERLTATPDLIPVVFADDGGSQFSEPCDRLAQMIRAATGSDCLVVPFQGMWHTVALISQLSAVLTTKLHVAIVAYAFGVYAESCGVHPKVLRFFKQIGRSHQCTLIHDLDRAIADEKISRVIDAAYSSESLQDDTWQSITQQARGNQDLVAAFVNAHISSSEQPARDAPDVGQSGSVLRTLKQLVR